MKVNANRNTPHMEQDKSARNLRLNFSINIGVKKATNRFKQPAPRFANFAPVELSPTDSKIDTE